MRKLPLLLIAIFAIQFLNAQTNQVLDPKIHPVWIQMMDNENVNYFEAVKAFELFWEDKDLPLEENELFTATKEEKEHGDLIAKRSKKANSDAVLYAFEYKKFKHWQQKVLPFVKEDGRIMTKDEQLSLWKIQTLNRK